MILWDIDVPWRPCHERNSLQSLLFGFLFSGVPVEVPLAAVAVIA